MRGVLVDKVCCLAAGDTGCSVTFVDSTTRQDMIIMFEHLKIFHPPIYAHYTENIQQWSMNRAEKKVNNSFSCGKNWNFSEKPEESDNTDSSDNPRE